MENPVGENAYEEAEQKAKEFYKSIGRVWCPVLGDYVAFNKIGFRHLLGRGRKPRSRSDQMRRFALLRYAVDILSRVLSRPNEASGFSISNLFLGHKKNLSPKDNYDNRSADRKRQTAFFQHLRPKNRRLGESLVCPPPVVR